MKAVFHIGMPKAGSTTIQDFLHVNQKALMQQSIRYHRMKPRRASQWEYAMLGVTKVGRELPINSVRRNLGHTSFADQRAEFDDFQRQFAQVRGTWTEPLFVASSEHLSLWLETEEEVQATDTWLKQQFDEVRYIVYIRRQADWVVSRYSEALRQGSGLSFEQAFRRMHTNDYDALVRRWEAAVGPDRLDVRLLDRDWLTNGDLIDDFCGEIGARVSGLKRPKAKNQSFSAEAAQVLMHVNRQLKATLEPQEIKKVRPQLLRDIGRMSAGGSRISLSRKQLKQVQDANKASNDALCARRFPERDTLFPQQARHTGKKKANRGIAIRQSKALAIAAQLLLTSMKKSIA